MRISSRAAVDAFIVMDVLEAARQREAAGQKVIHMEIGQPATPAPAAARAALARAMEAAPLGYTVALGLPELRARIARLYADWYGIALDPARVVVTAGSSAGFVLAFLALFEAGERVALGNPGYPSYRNILRALDLVPELIDTGPETRFQPMPDLLPDRRFSGLLVASPSNPTSTMLDRAALGALADACRARGAVLISDEIYHGIQFDGRRPVTALEVDDGAVVINSFSKFFSMTGWRVGWMVLPAELIRPVERLGQNLFICPPHAAQVAALGAFEGMAECEGHVARYAQNRALLVGGLEAAGFSRLAPCDGAFYLYADLTGISEDSRAFAAAMLAEAGVAATPGLDFDPHRGARFLRFSFAGATADMADGVARIGRWMAQR
ncbi:MAG: aminotransferase class I/II-fold pyridoxal phosphate-dependent enzyme [Pseudomonadota bacterium]